MPSLLFSVVNIAAAPHHNIVVGICMSSSRSFPWLIISICFNCGEMVEEVSLFDFRKKVVSVCLYLKLLLLLIN